MILKWTDGKPYERSKRKQLQLQQQETQHNEQQLENSEDQSAYSLSLNHDENTWDILTQSIHGSGFKITNKKEELGDKLSNRDMIQQIGVNPFLSKSNYIDDVSVRDQFLKPVNTTQGQRI